MIFLLYICWILRRMKFIDKYCPHCFRVIVVFLIKKFTNKQKNELGGIQELQEQEFQFTPSMKFNHQQQKQVNISKSEHHHSQKQVNDQHEQQLNYKMNFNSQPSKQGQQRSKLLSNQPQPSKLMNHDFKLNLQPYDQYYPLIQSKTNNIKEIFQSKTKNILTRNSKSMIKIQQIQTITGFKMIITYKLPCSYSYYNQINRDYQVVSQLNPVISSNQILETVHPNLTINHLGFKKFMLLEPRYFHYLKYSNSNQNVHWEVCTSVRGRPQTQTKQKQCQLTSITCIEETKPNLLVSSYLQVDLKSNLRASKVVLRVYQQLSTYIDNLYDYVLHNYQEESA